MKKINAFRLVFSTLFSLFILLISIPTQALTLEQLQQQLASHPTVRGDFIQTRNMAMFDAPLVSNGSFLLSSQHGLWWKQTTPFPTSLILTQDKLSQQIGTQAPQLMKSSDNPMVFYFSHVFLSVFKGDTKTLQDQFKLTFTDEASGWTIALKPRYAPLNKVFNSIEIKGQDYINTIDLKEVRGDETEIQFQNQSHQPEALTQAEQATFKL
ncbi:MAG: outer membrane lipoprotein carrier protein LolA [Vibrio sp.]